MTCIVYKGSSPPEMRCVLDSTYKVHVAVDITGQRYKVGSLQEEKRRVLPIMVSVTLRYYSKLLQNPRHRHVEDQDYHSLNLAFSPIVVDRFLSQRVRIHHRGLLRRLIFLL